MKLAKAWQHWKCFSSKLHDLEALKAFKAANRVRLCLRAILRVGETNSCKKRGRAFLAWRDWVAGSAVHKELLTRTRQVREGHRHELADLSTEIITLKGKQKELQVIVDRLKRREEAYQQKLNKLANEQSRNLEKRLNTRNTSRAKAKELAVENDELRAHVDAVEDNVCQFIEEMSEMLEFQKVSSPTKRDEEAAMFSKLASGLMTSSMRLKPKASAKRRTQLMSPSSSVRRK